MRLLHVCCGGCSEPQFFFLKLAVAKAVEATPAFGPCSPHPVASKCYTAWLCSMLSCTTLHLSSHHQVWSEGRLREMTFILLTPTSAPLQIGASYDWFSLCFEMHQDSYCAYNKPVIISSWCAKITIYADWWDHFSVTSCLPVNFVCFDSVMQKILVSIYLDSHFAAPSLYCHLTKASATRDPALPAHCYSA